MTQCLVYGRAETREQGLAFAQALGVATEIEGRIVPTVQCHITTSDDGWQVGTWTGEGENATFTPRSGWFFNVLYYGDSALALAQGGDPASQNVFQKFPGLVALAEARTGQQMEWTALGEGVPQGYECAAFGVRLYDPSAIATPTNVFA